MIYYYYYYGILWIMTNVTTLPENFDSVAHLFNRSQIWEIKIIARQYVSMFTSNSKNCHAIVSNNSF